MQPTERLGGLSHADWNEQMARRYDWFDEYHSSSWFPIRWLQGQRIRRVVAALPAEGSVLEVGCGPGYVLATVPREKVYGIDLSEHLVEMARQRLGERAEIRLGSAEALPYEDGRFDAVFCTEVLEHTLEPRTAVAECLRVLKPGGTLILTVPNDGLIHFLKTLVRRLGLGRLLEQSGPDGHQPSHDGHEWHLHQLDNKILGGWVQELGATDVRGYNLPVFFFPLHFLLKCRKGGA